VVALFESLLRLYPRTYRGTFAEEMVQVFRQAEADAEERRFGERAAFYLRELVGLIGGAVRERLRRGKSRGKESPNGESMKQKDQCRFPLFSILMMTIIFMIVIELIAKGEGLSQSLFAIESGRGWDLGRSARLWPSHWGLISGIATGFLIAWLAGVTAWIVAYAMRRTGAQKLGEFHTWPLPGE
jgi:hypothetical protein